MIEELKRHPRFWTLAVLLILSCSLAPLLFRPHSHTLTIAFLDVGQGDAIFIEAPNGNQLLYDAGPPTGAALRALRSVMPFWDRSIDVIVLSHPDLDHTGGFPEILRRYQISLALEPGKFSGNGAYETVEREISAARVAHFDVRAGMRLDLGDGAYAEFLYPDRDVQDLDTNDASVVMRVVYGDTSVLLSGDLPASIESQLALRYGDALHANILKLGHHGSRTSSAAIWLSAVHPDFAIISAGKNNRYGHPHKEVLDRLAEMHIPYLETMNEGTIMFSSEGVTLRRKS